MSIPENADSSSGNSFVGKYIPGISMFRNYRKEWFGKDIAAGLSVASIALPLGIAYASLAGLPPETGLYATILPMAVYALFGTSKQLIIGPDSATCLIVGSALVGYAAQGSPEYRALSSIFSLLVGVLAIISGLFKFGFVANFMSRPILTGYLNGLALSIIAGQLGKIFGFEVRSEGLIRMLIQFFSKLNETHLLTFVIGVSAFFFLRLMKRRFPKLPAPLIAIAVCVVLSWLLGFASKGVALVGAMPAGLPHFGIASIDFSHFPGLIPHSMEILLITYCSMMLTNKSFASKGGYKIEPNQEFIALGISNIFSGLSQGFVVSGADSRTAVNNSFGGKTQLVSVIAAVTVAVFVVFFTGYIEILPVAILGSIVVSASIGLFDISFLKRIYRINKPEFFIAVLTSLCVISIGVMPALVVAILLSFVMLIKMSSKPKVQVLGKVEETGTYHNLDTNESAVAIPGAMIFRFPSSLLFYNSAYFSESLNEKIAEHSDGLKAVIIDGEIINHIDVSGAEALSAELDYVRNRGIDVYIAAARSNIRGLLERSGINDQIGNDKICYTIDEAVEKFRHADS